MIEPVPAEQPQAPQTRKGAPARFRFGRLLHWVSHLKFPFGALGIYFQARAMFFTQGPALIDALSSALLMYGIAMSFEGLRDGDDVSEKHRRALLEKPRLFQATIAVVFTGGLFSIAVGCSQFFLSKDRELAWAITTFGLGMIALGRQQYDQFVSVRSKAPAAADGRASDTPPAGGVEERL